MKRMTSDELAVLRGAAELAAKDQHISPASQPGVRAVRALVDRGFLEFVGWTGGGQRTLYRITDAGRAALPGPSQETP